MIVDIGIAVLLALLVVILSPGLAVVGLMAVFVLVVCAISFAIDAGRGRRRAARARRRRSSTAPARRVSGRRR